MRRVDRAPIFAADALESSFMHRTAFSKLLLTIALIPAAVLMVLAGTLTYQSWSHYDDLVRASSLVRLAVAASRFGVIALPAEGAASRVYLGDGDRAKLEAQRRTTDDVYRALREAAAATVVKNARIEEQLKAIDAGMRDIADMREKFAAKAEPLASLVPLLVRTSGYAID